MESYLPKELFFAVWGLPELRGLIKSFMWPGRRSASWYEYRDGDAAYHHEYYALMYSQRLSYRCAPLAAIVLHDHVGLARMINSGSVKIGGMHINLIINTKNIDLLQVVIDRVRPRKYLPRADCDELLDIIGKPFTFVEGSRDYLERAERSTHEHICGLSNQVMSDIYHFALKRLYESVLDHPNYAILVDDYITPVIDSNFVFKVIYQGRISGYGADTEIVNDVIRQIIRKPKYDISRGTINGAISAGRLDLAADLMKHRDERIYKNSLCSATMIKDLNTRLVAIQFVINNKPDSLPCALSAGDWESVMEVAGPDEARLICRDNPYRAKIVRQFIEKRCDVAAEVVRVVLEAHGAGHGMLTSIKRAISGRRECVQNGCVGAEPEPNNAPCRARECRASDQLAVFHGFMATRHVKK